MRKYDVDLTAKYHVTFPDEQKVIDYFINGDWKNSFYTFSDLKELAESITMGFYHEDSKFDHDKGEFYKWLEGYPLFYSETNAGVWTSKEDGVVIQVEEIDELDIDYCTEQR